MWIFKWRLIQWTYLGSYDVPSIRGALNYISFEMNKNSLPETWSTVYMCFIPLTCRCDYGSDSNIKAVISVVYDVGSNLISIPII